MSPYSIKGPLTLTTKGGQFPRPSHPLSKLSFSELSPSDSWSDLRCSKTSGFVHQHFAPSVGIDTKSCVGSFSFFSPPL
ncbi:hypothetical protein FF1_034038 [Malus domestica]